MQAVLVFATLTYVVSWTLWIVAAAIVGWDLSRPSSRLPISGAVYLVGVFGPAIAATVLTARADGREAVVALLRRMSVWSVGARWYLFAAGYFAVIKLAVAVVHRVGAGEWPAFTSTPWIVAVAAIAFSTPVQAGEEIGWRGYLLPRLAARVGLPAATLIVGVIWGCWHLPFFFIAGTDKSSQPFAPYLLGVTALSVAMGWLYWRTQGSLLLTMVMHAAVNNTNLVPTPAATSADAAGSPALLAWATAALLSAGAVFFLFAMRGQGTAVGEGDPGEHVPLHAPGARGPADVRGAV